MWGPKNIKIKQQTLILFFWKEVRAYNFTEKSRTCIDLKEKHLPQIKSAYFDIVLAAMCYFFVLLRLG